MDTISKRALELISERDPQSDTCGTAAPSNCANNCIGCIARAALNRLLAPHCAACGDVMVWGTVCTPEWNGIAIGSVARMTVKKEPGWMCTRCAGVVPKSNPQPEYTQWPCWCGQSHSNADLR